MTASVEPVRAGTLKRLVGASPYFSRWDVQDYREVEPFANLVNYGAGEVLLALDDVSPYDYFLVEGSLALRSGRIERTLRATDLDAGFPVAHLRPSRYRIIASTDARVVRFESSRLKRLAARPRTPRFRVDVASVGGTWRGHPWVDEVEKRVAAGDLPVPPLPAVAMKVRQVMQTDDVDAIRLERIIGADPAIAARLVRVANSAAFRGQVRCDSLQKALVRLGLGQVEGLVTALGAKELFGATQPALRKRMVTVWQHSVEIAALCGVLARLTPGVAADRALLAGLLHDVGKAAVLKTAAMFPDLEETPGIVDEVLECVGPRASAAVLSAWKLPEDFQRAALHGGDWFYDCGTADAGTGDVEGSEKADLVHLVIIAHLHALVRQRDLARLPRIDETPAFKKLAGGTLSPQLSLLVLDESRAHVQELRAALI